VARAVCRELDSCPDGVLVDVSGPRENVQIVKQGRVVVVDVDSREETVHVSVPLRSVSKILSKLETWQVRSSDCKKNCGLFKVRTI
jgi:hypothetical protein